MKIGLHLAIVISVIIYVAIFLMSDLGKIDFSTINIIYIPLVLLMVFVGYLLRYGRWELYIKETKIKLSKKISFLVFFSGLSMSITPGKMGELIKSYLIKKINSTPISISAPLVIIERLVDGISMIFLIIIGSLSYLTSHSSLLVIISVVILSAIILFLRTKRVFVLFKKVPFINRLGISADQMHNSFRKLLTAKSIAVSLVLTLVAWTLEGIGLWLVINAFGFNVPILLAIFVFSVSSLLGILSALPGGIGITEGSMIVLLLAYMPLNIAAASVIVIRILTLWFSVIIGVIGYSVLIEEMKNVDKH